MLTRCRRYVCLLGIMKPIAPILIQIAMQAGAKMDDDFTHEDDEEFAPENRARLREDLEWLDGERMNLIDDIAAVAARYVTAVNDRFSAHLPPEAARGFIRDMIGVAADESLAMFPLGRLDGLRKDVGL